LIDSHALIHRAFHALPPLTTKKGERVNAATLILIGEQFSVRMLQIKICP
jgi:5'-3' exonuclease